mmetsp:Transcript_92255/g.246675  ORF Transcript_92255/g.246675 Transcript_92255/m.246675 type:complete len:408 (-) Transcript_92255:48-1271(-)
MAEEDGGRELEAGAASAVHSIPATEEDDVSDLADLSTGNISLRPNDFIAMSQHVKARLQQMIRSRFDDFLRVLRTHQNAEGTISLLECEVTLSASTFKFSVSCNEDGTFVAYCDEASVMAASSSSSTESHTAMEWVLQLSDFGMSGECKSLTALLQFGHSRWRAALSAPASSSCPPDEEARPRDPGAALVVLLDLGIAAFHRREFREAVDFLSEALDRSVGGSLAAHQLVEALALRSDAYRLLCVPSLALADADRLVREFPTEPVGYFRRAQALFGNGRRQEAAEACMQCTERGGMPGLDALLTSMFEDPPEPRHDAPAESSNAVVPLLEEPAPRDRWERAASLPGESETRASSHSTTTASTPRAEEAGRSRSTSPFLGTPRSVADVPPRPVSATSSAVESSPHRSL